MPTTPCTLRRQQWVIVPTQCYLLLQQILFMHLLIVNNDADALQTECWAYQTISDFTYAVLSADGVDTTKLNQVGLHEARVNSHLNSNGSKHNKCHCGTIAAAGNTHQAGEEATPCHGTEKKPQSATHAKPVQQSQSSNSSGQKGLQHRWCISS